MSKDSFDGEKELNSEISEIKRLNKDLSDSWDAYEKEQIKFGERVATTFNTNTELIKFYYLGSKKELKNRKDFYQQKIAESLQISFDLLDGLKQENFEELKKLSISGIIFFFLGVIALAILILTNTWTIDPLAIIASIYIAAVVPVSVLFFMYIIWFFYKKIDEGVKKINSAYNDNISKVNYKTDFNMLENINVAEPIIKNEEIFSGIKSTLQENFNLLSHFSPKLTAFKNAVKQTNEHKIIITQIKSTIKYYSLPITDDLIDYYLNYHTDPGKPTTFIEQGDFKKICDYINNENDCLITTTIFSLMYNEYIGRSTKQIWIKVKENSSDLLELSRILIDAEKTSKNKDNKIFYGKEELAT
ncbi:MAG: hypothetical protein ABIH20_01180, partial [Candidatus Diapherotrites archaeon]